MAVARRVRSHVLAVFLVCSLVIKTLAIYCSPTFVPPPRYAGAGHSSQSLVTVQAGCSSTKPCYSPLASIEMPPARAALLAKQANRPKHLEMALTWASWGLLSIVGGAGTSIALLSLRNDWAAGFANFLANPLQPLQHLWGDVYVPITLLVPGIIAVGSFLQAFKFRRMASEAGGLGVAAVKACGGQAAPTELKLRIQLLGQRAGLPEGSPQAYVIPSAEPNAFAAGEGPDDAVVAVTRGLLDALTGDELDAVLAHEIGHIYNGDMATGMQVSIMVAGFLSLSKIARDMLNSRSSSSSSSNSEKSSKSNDRGDESAESAEGLGGILYMVGLVLSFLGLLLQNAHSRNREFVADEAAVALTGSDALSRALEKIRNKGRDLQLSSSLTTESPHLAHLYIANHVQESKKPIRIFGSEMQPISSLVRMCTRVFDSHPETTERQAAIHKTIKQIRGSTQSTV